MNWTSLNIRKYFHCPVPIKFIIQWLQRIILIIWLKEYIWRTFRNSFEFMAFDILICPLKILYSSWSSSFFVCIFFYFKYDKSKFKASFIDFTINMRKVMEDVTIINFRFCISPFSFWVKIADSSPIKFNKNNILIFMFSCLLKILTHRLFSPSFLYFRFSLFLMVLQINNILQILLELSDINPFTARRFHL